MVNQHIENHGLGIFCVVGFDRGPLPEGQMRTAKLKSAYNFFYLFIFIFYFYRYINICKILFNYRNMVNVTDKKPSIIRIFKQNITHITHSLLIVFNICYQHFFIVLDYT